MASPILSRAFWHRAWTTLVSDASKSRITTLFFYLIATGIVLVGWRVVAGRTKGDEAKSALLLFASAAGIILARELIWLLPKIQSIKIGEKVQIVMREVEEMKSKTDDLTETVMTILESQGLVGGSAKESAVQDGEANHRDEP